MNASGWFDIKQTKVPLLLRFNLFNFKILVYLSSISNTSVASIKLFKCFQSNFDIGFCCIEHTNSTFSCSVTVVFFDSVIKFGPSNEKKNEI